MTETPHQDLTKYRSDLGEIATKLYLEKVFDLKLIKNKESLEKKTADYRIEDDSGKLLALCEVKSLLDIQSENLPKTEPERSWKLETLFRAKLRQQLGKALLKDFEDKISVIVFISFELIDCGDLHNVLNDEESFPSQKKADIYILIKVHQDIVGSNEFEVRYTPCIKFDPETGRSFAESFMDTGVALSRAGTLPLRFSLN